MILGSGVKGILGGGIDTRKCEAGPAKFTPGCSKATMGFWVKVNP